MLHSSMTIFGDKRKVVFVKRMSGIITTVGRPQFHSLGTTVVSFRVDKKKKLSFLIDMGKPFFRQNNQWVYFIDITGGKTGGQIVDTKAMQNIPSFSGAYVRTTSGDTIQKLVANFEKPQLLNLIINILIGISIGSPFGYIIWNFFPIK